MIARSTANSGGAGVPHVAALCLGHSAQVARSVILIPKFYLDLIFIQIVID